MAIAHKIPQHLSTIALILAAHAALILLMRFELVRAPLQRDIPQAALTYINLNFPQMAPKTPATTTSPVIASKVTNTKPADTSNRPKLATEDMRKPQTTAAITPLAELTSMDKITTSTNDTHDTHLDLDNIRQTAREDYRRGKRSEIEKMQLGFARDQSVEKQFGEKVKKAVRKDCRNAFAGAGLLAVIPIALSTVTDVGCNW